MTTHQTQQRRTLFRQALRPAFTLIELLVVIVIVSLVAALFIPQYGRLQQLARLRASSDELAGLLDQARTLAQAGYRSDSATPQAFGIRLGNAATEWEFLAIPLTRETTEAGTPLQKPDTLPDISLEKAVVRERFALAPVRLVWIRADEKEIDERTLVFLPPEGKAVWYSGNSPLPQPPQQIRLRLGLSDKESPSDRIIVFAPATGMITAQSTADL